MAERSTQSFPFSQFVRVQLVASLVIAVLLSLIFGQTTAVAVSALQGIAIAVIVNSWYCWRVNRDFREIDRSAERLLNASQREAHDLQGLAPEQTIARLYRTELLKLLVAAVLLGLTFKLGHVAHDAAFMVAFSLAWLFSAALINVLANQAQ